VRQWSWDPHAARGVKAGFGAYRAAMMDSTTACI